MAEGIYSVGIRHGQRVTPVQSGITNQGQARALKDLYPRRLDPSVVSDKVSISNSAIAAAKALAEDQSRVKGPQDLNRRQIDPREALKETESRALQEKIATRGAPSTPVDEPTAPENPAAQNAKANGACVVGQMFDATA